MALTPLQDDQVLQRTSLDGAELRSPYHVSVELVDSHGDVVAAAEPGGRFVAPTGGPYTVRACGSGERLAARVLVGDLWLLAGQSNMEGNGEWGDPAPPHPAVHVFGLDRRWTVAEEPLHRWATSPDPARWHGLSGAELDAERARVADAPLLFGTGLGLPFANELVARTGVPVGLVAAAHDGSSMADWAPARRSEQGGSLYGSLLLQLAGAGGRVAGVLWFQGESDGHAGGAAAYAEALAELHRTLQADLGDAARLQVQIGRMQVDPVSLTPMLPLLTDADWSRVRELQRTGPARAVVASLDLELCDFIHLDSASLKRLGRRLARVAAGAPPPALASVVRRADGALLRLEGLAPLEVGGTVEGFSWHDEEGWAPAAATVVSGLEVLVAPGPPRARLAYGYGLNPVVTLVDHDDMALPGFGPLEVS